MGQSFVKGAALLGAAAFISKLLGLFSRIPYQNLTGDEGLFIYQQVYPLYTTLLVLATAGFPIAVSKLVSERLALGDPNGAKRVYRVSAVVLCVTGVVFFCLLFFGARSIATWMGSPEKLTLPIKSVSFALLIVPLMSVIRGYFQGEQDMLPTAVSQITEQIVRVATIFIAAYWVTSRGMDLVYAGAGAVFGAVTGAITALITLLFFWIRRRDSRQEKTTTVTAHDKHVAFRRESVATIMKNVFYYAIPICFGSLVLPLLGLVDSFTVANLLEKVQGLTNIEAAIRKGVYDRGQPLIQFAAFFATALALSIVPAVAEALAKGQHSVVAARSELALRMTFLVGLPASIGLAVIATPANILLYRNDDGSAVIAILALTTVFSTLGVTSSGILQGLGRVVLPARNLMIGVVTKLVLNLLLTGPFGIKGAAAATVVAYAVSTGLNMLSLSKLVSLKVNWVKQLKPLVAAAVMGVVVYGLVVGMRFALAGVTVLRLEMLLTVLVAVTAGAIVYTVLLFRTGAITQEDLQAIPRLERKLTPWLHKFRLLN